MVGKSLDGLSLAEIFEPPWADPPVGPPPFGFESPVHVGQIPKTLIGQEVWTLVTLLFPELKVNEAKELTEFGSLWIDRRLVSDPLAKINGKEFRINLPAYKPQIYYEIDPKRLVFEDKDLLIYDKESGPPTVPVPHDLKNNLKAALERYTGLSLRAPHRLDAASSGLVIMAANRLSASRLSRGFMEKKIVKRYLALSVGPKPDFSKTQVEAVIYKVGQVYKTSQSGPGYPSQTIVTFLGEFEDKLLFLCQPLTGRTHQIRLHLAHLGYPIVGDKLYGGINGPRLALKASGLSFNHPGTGKLMTFGGPWPD
ncbi:MAG: RluA family pseudouridine synthase [Deltaproteobacteria bacterium]|jgi:RluA family pseudouridine synthase|nr:RluA family pseudouridine synthase [Deltaproteobacteria bacterium]